jgi:hypothetical protein
MRLSRRKRASAVEPTQPTSSLSLRPEVARPTTPEPTALPPDGTTPAITLPSALPAASNERGLPDAAPGPAPLSPPDGPTPSPLEHTGLTATTAPDAGADADADADLDRFFAALRQVVHDARERLPLEREPVVESISVVDAPAPIDDRADSVDVDDAASTAVTPWIHAAGGVVVAPGAVAADVSTAAELAPSTAELVAGLEADRDLWRERAIVWRERAMGADVLVKTLNAHLSDLQINLEDLRSAMRMLEAGSPAPEPLGELPAGGDEWDGLDRYLDSGA